MKRLLCLLIAAGMFAGICSDAIAESKKDYIMRTRRQKQECRDNMAAIYSALVNYASANKGALPAKNNAAGLAELVKYGLQLKNLDCPESRGKKIKKVSNITAKNISYIYFSGINLKNAIKSCPNLPLVIDRPDSRHYTALLADGSVIEIDTKKYKRKISNCLDLLAILNSIYDYPPDILNSLRVKAKNIDRQLGLK